MNRIPYAIRLSGRDRFGREAPPRPIGAVLVETGPAVRQAIAMGFIGRSATLGRPPRWLDRAADVRFVGIDGDAEGDTVLYFEAPLLGEAAEEVYRQGEFWSTKPDGADTGFDLLGDVLADVAAHREDSERYDSPMLRRIGKFEKLFARAAYQSATLTDHRLNGGDAAVINEAAVSNARLLDSEMPIPQQVRVAGTLDMIRLSSQGFELILDDGTRARGVLIEGDMLALKPLTGTRVLVQGQAIYRPSGRLLRIDARRVDAGLDAPGLWSQIPAPRRNKLDPRSIRRNQGPSSGVSAFYGTWPGDETDEQWSEIIERVG